MTGKGSHGDEVDVLLGEFNPSESKIYSLVRVKNSNAKGWVPETLIHFEPLEEEKAEPAPTEDKNLYHVVQAGDALGTIAQKYGTTI